MWRLASKRKLISTLGSRSRGDRDRQRQRNRHTKTYGDRLRSAPGQTRKHSESEKRNPLASVCLSVCLSEGSLKTNSNAGIRYEAGIRFRKQTPNETVAVIHFSPS